MSRLRTSNLVISLEPFGMRPADAAQAIGSVALFEDLVKAGWLKPVVKRHKLTLYSTESVKACWCRILRGDPLPTPEANRRAAEVLAADESTAQRPSPPAADGHNPSEQS